MKIKPLKNYLLVRLEDRDKTTKSGIILVDSTKDNLNIAKIIETADIFDEDEDVFLKGDRILIKQDIGVKVKVEDKEYLIISQKDVLAFLD